MTSAELIQELRTITKDNLTVLKSKFSNLTETQKSWKVSENSWNISEIFAHLNSYAAYYHENFLLKIKNTSFTTPSENFISSPLGRSAWKSMKLGNAKNVKRKMKSPKIYNPRLDKKLLSGKDVEQFEANLEQLSGIIESSQKVNLRRIKIPISISKIIRLRLGDALLFVVYHNQRHLQQAVNIISNPKFPQ
jgi:hypothetical protein